MGDVSYVSDWTPIPAPRYEQAQGREVDYWDTRPPELLTLNAKYYFYAGFYEWTKHRELLNPFRVDPSRPQNFQIPGAAIEGRAILDVGCGPSPATLSLVHCASVHAVDPLAEVYREIQPFGWDFLSSLSSAGAEQLPFDDRQVDFVYCWNTLDHTQDAESVLREVVRVLAPDGHLLLGCDVRSGRGGGLPHPYYWTLDTFEERLLADFAPVTPITLLDHEKHRPVARAEAAERRVVRWVARLRKKAGP